MRQAIVPVFALCLGMVSVVEANDVVPPAPIQITSGGVDLPAGAFTVAGANFSYTQPVVPFEPTIPLLVCRRGCVGGTYLDVRISASDFVNATAVYNGVTYMTGPAPLGHSLLLGGFRDGSITLPPVSAGTIGIQVPLTFSATFIYPSPSGDGMEQVPLIGSATATVVFTAVFPESGPPLWRFDAGQFRMESSTALPTAPIAIAPSGTTTATPTFSWSAVPNATGYSLWVDDASQEGKIQQVYDAAAAGCAAGTGTCSVTPAVALATGAGTWWVKATSAAGDGPWSADRTFTIAAPTTPGAPTLIGPSGKTSLTPTFSWAAVPAATSYALWVDDAKTEGKIQQIYTAAEAGCAAGTSICAVAPRVTLADGTGTFWVKATNALGDGSWSADGSFTAGTY